MVVVRLVAVGFAYSTLCSCLVVQRARRGVRRHAAEVADASESVVVEKAGDRGLGVFSTALILKGSFVVDYVGEYIDEDELFRRHPSLEPEYAFRTSEEETLPRMYIDAENSDHWSKRMNHDAVDPTLDFEVSADPPRVRFTALRDIEPTEELTFDYGLEYWDGRSSSPEAATDARIYAAPVFCDSVSLGVPLSEGALDDVLAAWAPDQEKVAAIRRALDYFGVDQAAVEVPPARLAALLGALTRRPAAATVVDAKVASPSQLARALRACFAWDDDDDDDDDDE